MSEISTMSVESYQLPKEYFAVSPDSLFEESQQDNSQNLLNAALAEARKEEEARLAQELPKTTEKKHQLIQSRTSVLVNQIRAAALADMN